MKKLRSLVTSAAVAAALASCVAVPRSEPAVLRPQAPLTDPYATAAASWPARAWWKALGDPQLDALIARALQQSPDLQVAQARVAAAHASTASDAASTGTRLSAGAGISRQRISEDGLLSSRLLGFKYYNQADTALRLDVDFDWWGARRAQVEAAIGREQAATAQRQAAELALVSGITAHYLDWQTAAARGELLKAYRNTIAGRRALQAQRTAAGIDAPDALDRLALEDSAARDEASRVAGAQDQSRLALAALMGVSANRLPGLQMRAFAIRGGLLPADASLGLIARRPDIVASRWRVEAAAQDVLQSRAAFYPDLKLNALAGFSSLDLARFLSPANFVSTVGASIYLPIFDARRLRARHGVVQAQLDLAISEYDAAVVAAALEVSAEAALLQRLAERRGELERRTAAVDRLHAVTLAQAHQGLLDARSVYDSDAEQLRVHAEALQLDAECSAHALALVKALGGGVALPAVPTLSSSAGVLAGNTR